MRYLGAMFQSVQGFLPALARIQHWVRAGWAWHSRQYGTVQGEKGVWLMSQLHGACVLPAGSFACELWGVWLLRGQPRKIRDYLSTVYHGHLSSLSGVRRMVPTPILLEELGQRTCGRCGLLVSEIWS